MQGCPEPNYHQVLLVLNRRCYLANKQQKVKCDCDKKTHSHFVVNVLTVPCLARLQHLNTSPFLLLDAFFTSIRRNFSGCCRSFSTPTPGTITLQFATHIPQSMKWRPEPPSKRKKSPADAMSSAAPCCCNWTWPDEAWCCCCSLSNTSGTNGCGQKQFFLLVFFLLFAKRDMKFGALFE